MERKKLPTLPNASSVHTLQLCVIPLYIELNLPIFANGLIRTLALCVAVCANDNDNDNDNDNLFSCHPHWGIGEVYNQFEFVNLTL